MDINPNTVLIRRLTPKDQDLLIYVGRKTFDDTFRGTCTDEDMLFSLNQFYNPEQVEKELNDQEDYFWGACLNDELIGFYRMHIGAKTCPVPAIADLSPIELKRIYLLESAQGIGLGKKLLDHSISFAKELGRKHVYLSVWEFNFKAQAFYHKNGFTDSGIKNDFPLGNTPQTDLWYIKEI